MSLLRTEQGSIPLGTVDNPAISCQHIAQNNPTSLPGYKTIRTPNGETHNVYCVMQVPCSENSDGWTRVAYLDMTNPTHTCPRGLRQINSPKRVCGRSLNHGGCNSVTFDSNSIPFTKICGRVIGYHFGTPSGFAAAGSNIDSPYVEGVSLTHGLNPRKHIWTFANALQEEVPGTQSWERGHVCPCTHSLSTMQVPSFVGSDYFCDSGSRTTGVVGTLYTADPLWDGQGCEVESTCCEFNSPPWFYKHLPQPTNDNIELRICADQEALHDEDSPVEIIELLVQ